MASVGCRLPGRRQDCAQGARRPPHRTASSSSKGSYGASMAAGAAARRPLPGVVAGREGLLAGREGGAGGAQPPGPRRGHQRGGAAGGVR
eukprot:CAMPEP_0118946118 /NCGR_PEP_ID=MMETSP1169-20130426/43621_1 /TAXON_ID=36882 /ORGANISM="Pyramimonas obovata, Strain CCMP722" /LENGTH=89 /DNA_ID=CAMNT_0006892013 /DNA_START=406 /DNA_END=672 /DNA_ORIENTATION=-